MKRFSDTTLQLQPSVSAWGAYTSVTPLASESCLWVARGPSPAILASEAGVLGHSTKGNMGWIQTGIIWCF